MDRKTKNQAKQKAILDAALDIFSAKGVAAARVEDIARLAGVGKGTIYLYFNDKEGIFSALLADILLPIHQHTAEILREEGLDLREKLWRIAKPFLENNGISRVGKAIRLTHAEGLHNPHLVQPYLEFILTSNQRIQEYMRQAGLPAALCQHPLLVLAPLLHGVAWQGLMEQKAPIDFESMFHTHLDLLFGAKPEV